MFFVIPLCFFKCSINKCILLLCITINQARTPINVISFPRMGLGYESCASFPSYQKPEKISQVFHGLGTCWERKPVVRLCHLAIREPIPCSPAPLIAYLAEPWPTRQLSHTWLLTLGFLELVKPVY